MKQRLEKPGAQDCLSQHCEKREIRTPQKDQPFAERRHFFLPRWIIGLLMGYLGPAPERSTEATAMGLRFRMLERPECI
jgi:hypothetical protein